MALIHLNPYGNAVPYATVATATLLVYDFICTFDQEVSLIWHMSWSLVKVLYFLNRYPVFIDTFINVVLTCASTIHSAETCEVLGRILGWMIIIGLIFAESILMVRTYAIWGKKRIVLCGLFAFALCIFIPMMIITKVEMDSQVSASGVPGATGSCVLIRASRILLVDYILNISCESAIVVLTFMKGVRHLRQSHSNFVLKLYQNGLLSYCCLLVLSISNLLVFIKAPIPLTGLLVLPQRVLHSLLCSRVLLSILRNDPDRINDGESSSSSSTDKSVTFSTVAVSVQVVDNVDHADHENREEV